MEGKEMMQEVIAGIGWFAMCVLCAIAIMILSGCTPLW